MTSKNVTQNIVISQINAESIQIDCFNIEYRPLISSEPITVAELNSKKINIGSAELSCLVFLLDMYIIQNHYKMFWCDYVM